MNRDLTISVMGFHKRYGSVNALRGLDLDICRGVFGLIGPNC